MTNTKIAEEVEHSFDDEIIEVLGLAFGHMIKIVAAKYKKAFHLELAYFCMMLSSRVMMEAKLNKSDLLLVIDQAWNEIHDQIVQKTIHSKTLN